MNLTLDCPRPGCTAKLPYVNAKKSKDGNIRIWRRTCPECGVTVTDSAIYSREVRYPEQTH